MVKEFNGLPATFGLPVPDVFADEAVAFDIINGTLRIAFGTITRTEPVPPSNASVAVIGRLIMPIESAQRLCLGLYDFLQKQGLDPKSLASGTGTAQ